MAQYDLVIKAVDQTKSTFASIERSMAGLQATANKVQGAFVAMIGGLSAGRIIDTAKEFQQLEVRLKAVSAAGTDTTALLKQLTAASSGTVGGVNAMVEAYAQLRLAGLDASTSTIQALKNLAGASGNELGRTAEIIGKAFRGEFGKLDDFGIEVENRYGQFVVKYQGQTQAIVSNTADVVNTIIKLSNTNASFADAAAARAKTLDAQLGKLRGTLESGIGASNLGESLANIVSKLNDFLEGSGNVTKAANYLASAINFIGDNFKAIIGVLGGLLLVFKVIDPLILGISKGVNVFGQALRVMGGIIPALLTPFKYLYDAVYYFGVNMLRAFGILESGFPILASLTFALRGLAVGLLRFAGWVGIAYSIVEGVNLIVKAFTGFDILDWVSNKFDNMYEAAKRWMGIGKEVAKTTAADFQRTDKDTTPVAGAVKDITGGKNGKEANTLIQDLIGNYNKLRTEVKMLQSAMANTTDVNLASKIFEELNNRMYQLGIVIEKPLNLINRDFALGIAKTTEELRQHNIELSNTSALNQKWANELEATNQQIEEQQMKLSNAALMSKKFIQELAQVNLQQQETALKLRDTVYQQDIFSQSVIKVRQEVKQQTITLGLLNDAFAQGKISLQEYSDGLGQINERLLTANNLATIATSQGIDEVTGLAKRKEALALVTAEYAAGRLSVEQYAQAYEKLKGAYDNTPTAIVIDQATKQAAKIDDLKAKARDLTKQVQDGTISWKTYGEAVKAIGEDYFPNYQANIEQAMTMTELLNKTIEDGSAKAGKALTESLTNAIRTGKGLFSSLKDFVNTILTDIANAIIRKQFVNPIVNALTGSIMPSAAGGSGIGSGFSSWLGNLFGGGGGSAGGIPAGMSPETLALAGLATGGPAQANTPYLIGEAGPELFVPNTNGTVVPNDALGGNIVVNLNLSAIDTQSGVEFLVKNRATITGVIQSAFNRNAKVGIA